ncbi:MAG: nucleotide-binding protein [Candidatus Bathyarchaeota archaeon]|nr:nucleotide-binding protein [Candidatus Bathyarchaeum sp.]
MSVDFGALIIELESLVSSSKEDFANEFWSSYENYIQTYNRLLKDVQSLGFYKQLNPIEEVPFSDQAFDSGYTKQEKAKLREIVNQSNILLQKVKLLLSPPATTKLNSQVRSNQIFLFYEKVNPMVSDVTNTLENLGLEAITVNGPQELKDKTVAYPQVYFAVVILSPDQANHQPTKNTIYTLGYLVGRLGDTNVVAIYPKKQGLEIAEYSNILWIEYKTGWYLKLVKELEAANFEVDANKLSWL